MDAVPPFSRSCFKHPVVFRSVLYLSMTDDGLAMQPTWVKSEFAEKIAYCKEFTTEIVPDAAVMEGRSFRGLLFSVY